MTRPDRVPLADYRPLPEPETVRRAAAFYADLRRRRSVRDFSDRPVPREVIEDCLRAAGTAPSGASVQPWYFVAVGDPEMKRRIRQATEEVERKLYGRAATQPWLEALAPLGTDAHKPFLEKAPYLIVVFGVLPASVQNIDGGAGAAGGVSGDRRFGGAEVTGQGALRCRSGGRGDLGQRQPEVLTDS